MNKNEYFTLMGELLAYANGMHTMAEKIRKQARKAYPENEDFQELVYAMEKEIKVPYSNGEIKAFRTWRDNTEKGEDRFVLDDFLFEIEIAGFVYALREAGVERFYTTNHSTALMDNIHGFLAAGCTLVGPAMIEVSNSWNKATTAMALEFEVN